MRNKHPAATSFCQQKGPGQHFIALVPLSPQRHHDRISGVLGDYGVGESGHRDHPVSRLLFQAMAMLVSPMRAPQHLMTPDALQLPSRGSGRAGALAPKQQPRGDRSAGARRDAWHMARHCIGGSRGREAIRPGVLDAPASARSWGRTAPATRHSGNRLAPGADLGAPLPASRQMGWSVSPTDRDTNG